MVCCLSSGLCWCLILPSPQLGFLPFKSGEPGVFWCGDLSWPYFFPSTIPLGNRSLLFSLVSDVSARLAAPQSLGPRVPVQRWQFDPTAWLPFQSLTFSSSPFFSLDVTGSLVFLRHKSPEFSLWESTACWEVAAGGLPAPPETHQMVIWDISGFPCLKGRQIKDTATLKDLKTSRAASRPSPLHDPSLFTNCVLFHVQVPECEVTSQYVIRLSPFIKQSGKPKSTLTYNTLKFLDYTCQQAEGRSLIIWIHWKKILCISCF